MDGVFVNKMPDEIWTFYQENKGELSDGIFVFASNPTSETYACITSFHDRPLLTIMRDDEVIYQERITSKSECEHKCEKAINEYLYDINDVELEFEDESLDLTSTLSACEDICKNSEENIRVAFINLLEVLGKDGNGIEFESETHFQNLLENVVKLIAKEFPTGITRPYIDKHDDGSWELKMFPYAEN